MLCLPRQSGIRKLSAIPIYLNMKKVILTTAIITFVYSLVFPIIYFVPSIRELSILFFLGSPILIVIIVIGFIISLILLIISVIKKRDVNPFIRWSNYLFILSFMIFPITYIFPKPLPTGSYEMKFEEQLWKNAKLYNIDQKYSVRQRMVGNLIDHILPNKKETEIITILGEPSTKKIEDSEKFLLYEMGQQRDGFFNIDTEILEIYLDENNIYKEAIVQVY